MSKGSSIRVLIVDDHTIVREGLVTLLEVFPDLELVGEVSNGEEAIRLCAERQPNIVLMDLVMPGMDGMAAIESIHKKHPEIKILVLTSFVEKDYVKEALAAGAIGYLIKSISADDLARAIRDAHKGKLPMAPEATRELVNAFVGTETPGHDLTEREREVLSLIVKGFSNDQIAEQLYISPATAKNHVAHILSKLQVTSRTAAATLAIQYEIVAPP